MQYLEHVDTDDHMNELFLMICYRIAQNEALFWKQVNFASYFPYPYFSEILCPVRKSTDSAVFEPESIEKHCTSKERILNNAILRSVHMCTHVVDINILV